MPTVSGNYQVFETLTKGESYEKSKRYIHDRFVSTCLLCCFTRDGSGHASEAIFVLKPVTFRYQKQIDSNGIPQFGLVVEDVEKVNPDLVVRDKEGKPYTLRYEQINAMLLNEFLKEHNKLEDLEATVASLAATVQEQAAQIRRGRNSK